MSGQLALALGEPEAPAASLWETLPAEHQAEVIVRLASLLARLTEDERDY